MTQCGKKKKNEGGENTMEGEGRKKKGKQNTNIRMIPRNRYRETKGKEEGRRIDILTAENKQQCHGPQHSPPIGKTECYSEDYRGKERGKGKGQ